MSKIYHYHAHRIIEVIADDEAEAERLLEAELHDDESVLSMEVCPDE